MASIGKAYSDLSTWKKAVVIAAPIAIAGGLIYTKYRSKNDTKTQVAEEKQQSSADVSDAMNNVKAAMHHLEVKTAGNKNFKNQKYQRAIECYSEAIRICPEVNTKDAANCYQNRAACYEILNKPKQVVEDCTLAIELEPKYLKAYRRRAEAYEKLEMYTKAFADRAIQCKMEGFKNTRTMEKSDILLQKASIQRSKEFMEDMKPSAPSVQFIEKYLTSYYQDPVTKKHFSKEEGDNNYQSERINLAIAEHRYCDIADIVDDEMAALGTGNQLTVKYQYLTLVRATFDMLFNNYTAAVEGFNVLIDYDQVNSEIVSNALIKRASISLQDGNVESSKKDLSTALVLCPDNGDIYYNRAQMNLVMNNLELANQDYKKASEISPDFDVGHSQRCFSLFKTGFNNKQPELIVTAIAEFEKAIERFPKCLSLRALYGQSLMDQHKYALALAQYNIALKIKPNDIGIVSQKTLLNMQRGGDTAQLIEEMKAALATDETCKMALEIIATIYLQIGDEKNAMEYMMKAIKTCSREAEVTHMISLYISAETRLLHKDVLAVV